MTTLPLGLPEGHVAARIQQWLSIAYATALHSPIFEVANARFLAFSLAGLHLTFHLLARVCFTGKAVQAARSRSWILTTLGAAGMTAASLPYLYDMARLGFDLDYYRIDPRTETVALPVAWFFLAYLTSYVLPFGPTSLSLFVLHPEFPQAAAILTLTLKISDLGLGSVYYRSQINFVTGWIHHSVYTVLFLYIIHNRWTYLSAVTGILELPTLIMGMGSLFPRVRSNWGFALSFFATRIGFHLMALRALASERTRSMPLINGSYAPFVCLALPFPMHVWWGYKTVCSLYRRYRKTRSSAHSPDPLPAHQPIVGVAISPENIETVSAAEQLSSSGASRFDSPLTTAALRSALQRVRWVRIPATLRASFHGIMESKPQSYAQGERRGSNPFTAPVAPSPSIALSSSTALPFLAIRSSAETSGKARRLLADTARRTWHRRAPETWRREVEREMLLQAQQRQLSTAQKWIPSKPADSISSARSAEDESARAAVARRVAIRLARRVVIGPTASYYSPLGRVRSEAESLSRPASPQASVRAGA